ncbi:MAG: sulfatase [Planctomycetes bacterium]|nr:sulfatase [Planctomycetota bacterium]
MSAHGAARRRAGRARVGAACALLALFVLPPAGCGDAGDPSPPPEAASPVQWSVTSRALRWRADGEAPAFSRVDAFTGADAARAAAAWTSDGPIPARLLPDGLHLEALDAAVLRGPSDLFVDPALLQRLELVARVDDVERVELVLAADDGALTEPGPTAEAHDDGDGRRTFAFPLTGLRGPREGRVAPFELRFVGSHPRVVVAQIALRSDFDAPSDAPRVLLRGGALRRGDVLVPGRVARLDVPAGARARRLRVSLAAAGCDAPLALEVRDPSGRVPSRTLAPRASDGFCDLRLDLAPWDGSAGALELTLAADAPPGSAALVGAVLLLEPAPRAEPVTLLYLVDTLRADRLSTYGYGRPTDPHLRGVAADGVVFEHVQAAASWTRPSVSTLLTGLEPPSHGNRRQGLRVADDAPTLAEALAHAGFVTASFVTNPQGGQWSGLERGFDLAHEPSFAGADRVASSLTSEAIETPLEELLAAHADERLFVWVHTLDPHRPYRPEPDDLRAVTAGLPRPVLIGPGGRDVADDSLAYDAEILHNDRMLARLDDALDRLGLRERTLFVLVADHGEAFGEHGRLEHKETLFGEELRVPWVLRWPGVLPAGRRLSDAAGLVDVAPTLAGLLGVDAPAPWQGRDLSPLLRGDVATTPAVPLLAELLPEDDTRPHLLAALRWPYRLVCEAGPEGLVPLHLFDLDEDPLERDDRVDDPALAAPRASLAAWIGQRLALAVQSERADASDAGLRRWLSEMGYLQDDR